MIRSDLSGVARFGQQFAFSLTYAGVPLNLTGYAVTLILKASAVTPDALAVGVYTAGAGLTLTSAADGQFTWDAPAGDLTVSAPGSLWYRVDVSLGDSDPAPAMYGALWLAAA